MDTDTETTSSVSVLQQQATGKLAQRVKWGVRGRAHLFAVRDVLHRGGSCNSDFECVRSAKAQVHTLCR